MSTTAIPSAMPEDLLLNAENLDKFINSTESSFINRFGVEKLTIAGITSLLMASSLSFDSLGNPLPDDFGSLPSMIVNDAQGRVSTITKSGESGTYVQTFTYPDGVTTNISAWVKQ